ncbi:N-acetylmuramic acid 6-phosphate etherase [Cytobacillus spongiae]|uniref:N-acetylmuramic acid 6-phosphate etherase n=1 Tax=Cytobacillus spongiae TaxID=2901381 RepID=UPI001F1BDF64|nr:N-acetylmuramic acid 6-phosphate etherase [Cytobacillus spongiae]UII55339.1 N-acetylmuramic acid 6-phosphate etherase [Cytobacillus spongiae]
MDLTKILTETRNPNTMEIDTLSTEDMLKKINEEDQTVALAVGKTISVIAKVVDSIVEKMEDGGRLLYIGAGTSGRLGILDASECPPTYSTDPEKVVAIIAGGEQAIQYPMEGAEDDEEAGIEEICVHQVSSKDVVVGIAASGRTPYTIGALKEAKKRGAVTASIVCSPNSPMGQIADHDIVAEVGPEVVTGSTRMKAGTAQKLILNMLTTASMIKLGKVYSNLMVDVMPSNEKLKIRSRNIIMEAADASEEEAIQALDTHGAVKPAILSLLTGLGKEDVAELLKQHKGHLRAALKAAVKS